MNKLYNPEIQNVELSDVQSLFQEILYRLEKLQHPTQQVYTIEEVAKTLKCSVRTVKHHLYESHDLRYLIVGREVRIREQDLREFLENQRMPCVLDREVLP